MNFQIFFYSAIVINCVPQETLCQKNSATEIYKSGREVVFVDKVNKTFVLKELPRKYADVEPLECKDTLAFGYFQMVEKSLMELSNDRNFHKVNYDILQETKYSPDSLYFQIVIKDSSDFWPGQLAFNLYFTKQMMNLDENKLIFKVAKLPESVSSNYSFSLIIHDLKPNCWPEKKCFQRIYFKIFESFDYSLGANAFRITLYNFNRCYLEKMDVDNELVRVGRKAIFWRGNTYKRVY